MKEKVEPLVSVIMPAYNAAQTINGAIDSILGQTYKNIEFVIVDDGSKDETANIINSYADSRIHYYKNEQNMGLVNTLNRAIGLCTGKYIARMDSDDISLPERLSKQVKYMESHEKCIICGAYIKTFTEDVATKKKKFCGNRKYETNDNEIKEELAFECCFAHPTVMFRKSLFSQTDIRYDNDFLNSEDYKYWIELMNYGEYHNIPEYLLLYRLSPTQMSASSSITFVNSSKSRMIYILKSYGKDVYRLIQLKPINRDLIQLLKMKGITNNYLYKLLYLSFESYSVIDLFYYILSLDIIRQKPKTFFQLAKRIVFGPRPIFKYFL